MQNEQPTHTTRTPRPIVQLVTTLHAGKPNESHSVVSAYACRNGLAVGHPVRQDSEGAHHYAPGWIVYHIMTGAVVSTPDETLKTPAAAMRFLRTRFKGRLLPMLRRAADREPAPDTHGIETTLGKLKKFPPMAKPKGNRAPGTERIAAKGYSALLAFVADIDAAISTATRTSKQQRTFTIGRSRFTVGAHLEALQRLRARVIKNRAAFADSALPPVPVGAIHESPALTAADFVSLTCEQAGQLSPDQARDMLGHWWMSGEGESRVHTEEGRQQIHRAWLRHTFNRDSSGIQIEVLQSHALELPAFDAHCWFARQLYKRQDQPAPVIAAQAKPQASAQAPARPRKARARPPERDVWYYLTHAGTGSRKAAHA